MRASLQTHDPADLQVAQHFDPDKVVLCPRSALWTGDVRSLGAVGMESKRTVDLTYTPR